MMSCFSVMFVLKLGIFIASLHRCLLFPKGTILGSARLVYEVIPYDFESCHGHMLMLFQCHPGLNICTRLFSAQQIDPERGPPFDSYSSLISYAAALSDQPWTRLSHEEAIISKQLLASLVPVSAKSVLRYWIFFQLLSFIFVN